MLLAALVPQGAPSAAAAGRTASGHTTKHAAAPALTAGYGRVTPAYRRAIDHVVDAPASRGLDATSSKRALVDGLVRCATFEGQRYCLGTGWTDRTQAELRTQTMRQLTKTPSGVASGESTGDLSAADALRQEARLSPEQRARADRAELTRAARSVAKVWLLRHQIQGVPLPHGFYARHPEVRRAAVAERGRGVAKTTSGSDGGGRHKVKRWGDYPSHASVLDAKDVTEQHRTYWCGPTTMQMIAWGWQQKKRAQLHWAHRLGTTTDGSSITAMVHVVNQATGYDKPSYAGPYITLDISDWSFKQWKLLIARHVVDYRSPVVLHPVLLQRFYPYLDHDGSGHFQVGRGYRKRPGKTPLLGYFEPWNQQRFHPDEPFIDRVQWREAYKSYRANEAHFQHDLGV
ncbi:MAG: C39 family peptidase [Nocardioides sp.]